MEELPKKEASRKVSMSELAWENMQERQMKKDKRYCIVIIILILSLLLSNLVWVWLWNQYDTVSIDNSGGDAYYNEQIRGDVNNGVDKS